MCYVNFLSYLSLFTPCIDKAMGLLQMKIAKVVFLHPAKT